MKRDRHAHLGRTSAHRSFFLNQIGACHILLHTTSNQSHETTMVPFWQYKELRKEGWSQIRIGEMLSVHYSDRHTYTLACSYAQLWKVETYDATFGKIFVNA